jgi:hypothetical protein
MNRRFTALRVIGTFLKVLAWIALILGLLTAVLLLILGLTLQKPLGIIDFELGGALVGVVGFVVVLISSVIGFLFLYAAGEFLYVVLSIEDSARRAAYFAQEQYRSQQQAWATQLGSVPYADTSDD